MSLVDVFCQEKFRRDEMFIDNSLDLSTPKFFDLP